MVLAFSLPESTMPEFRIGGLAAAIFVAWTPLLC
jgi:hypothetical protein